MVFTSYILHLNQYISVVNSTQLDLQYSIMKVRKSNRGYAHMAPYDTAEF